MRDAGIGYRSETTEPGHFGPLLVERVVVAAGGTVALVGNPDGTVATVRVPLEAGVPASSGPVAGRGAPTLETSSTEE